MKESEHQVVPGICISPSGQATVDPSLTNVLFDLALKLEEPTNLPVDVQHVLAAVVLAAREGKVDSQADLSADDPRLVEVLMPHVKAIFAEHDGKVGEDD